MDGGVQQLQERIAAPVRRRSREGPSRYDRSGHGGAIARGEESALVHALDGVAARTDELDDVVRPDEVQSTDDDEVAPPVVEQIFE